MLSTEKIWDFWDIVGPVSLLVYAFIVLFSLYSWRKGASLFLFVGAILNTLIAFLFSWSIGKYLIIVPILFNVLFSTCSWRKGSSLFLFASAILSSLIAFLFSWSIGKYLIIVPILQLIAAIYILVTRYRRKKIG